MASLEGCTATEIGLSDFGVLSAKSAIAALMGPLRGHLRMTDYILPGIQTRRRPRRRRADQRPYRLHRALMKRLIDLHQKVLLGDVDGFDRGCGKDIARPIGRAGNKLTAAEGADARH